MPYLHSLTDRLHFMRGNMWVFSVTEVLGNFSRRMAYPFVSLYILSLGGDAAGIGVVNSLMPLAGLLVFPLAGIIADRSDRVRLIVLANGLFSGVVLLYALAPRWEVFALAGLLQGFTVFQYPASSSLIADSLHPRERGRGIALMNAAANSLAVSAPFIAGEIVGRYGPNRGVRILYSVMLAAYMAATLIYARGLKEISRTPRERLDLSGLSRDFVAAYANIPILLRQLPLPLKALAGVIVLNFTVNTVAGPFWVVYAVQHIGLTPEAWGIVLSIEAAFKFAAFIPAGVIIDRWGRTRSLLTALVLTGLAIPSFAFARGFADVLAIRLVVAVAYTLALPACTALMADLVPRDIRGQVMAALGQGAIMIGMPGGGMGGPSVGYVVIVPLIISSLVGGLLYARNPTYTWFFVLAAMAIAILLTVCFIRDPKRAEV